MTISDICPVLAVPDLIDSSFGDPKATGILYARELPRPYFTHSLLSEFSPGGTLASIIRQNVSSFRHHVSSVVAKRPNKEVVGIYTSGCIAAVQHAVLIGKRASVNYPGGPVRLDVSFTTLSDTHNSIAEVIGSAPPEPTATIWVFLDFIHQTFG